MLAIIAFPLSEKKLHHNFEQHHLMSQLERREKEIGLREELSRETFRRTIASKGQAEGLDEGVQVCLLVKVPILYRLLF